ncbi:MAG: zinc-binding dehydrogenase, partial [Nocardioidaceae bacterium]|nr:zinc-binding dehydrogenase [Nocardioidaceae bacterium]
GRVVAVAREETARERATAYGADAVVPMDADPDRLAAALGEALPSGADVVVDPVWGPAGTAAGRVLAPGGRLVNIGSAGGAEAVFSSPALRSRSAAVLGYTNNAITPDQREAALHAVLRHAEAGRVAVAHETVALRDVEAAWRRQSEGSAGRLVLLP